MLSSSSLANSVRNLSAYDVQCCVSVVGGVEEGGLLDMGACCHMSDTVSVSRRKLSSVGFVVVVAIRDDSQSVRLVFSSDLVYIFVESLPLWSGC